jgi:hypothetical protein
VVGANIPRLAALATTHPRRRDDHERHQGTLTPKALRQHLGVQLHDIETLASSLARQEREGAPAGELEVKLMLLQDAINETRQAASNGRVP